MTPKQFAQAIKQFRAQMRWSQGTLAGHLGVSQQAVQRWESGKLKKGPSRMLLRQLRHMGPAGLSLFRDSLPEDYIDEELTYQAQTAELTPQEPDAESDDQSLRQLLALRAQRRQKRIDLLTKALQVMSDDELEVLYRQALISLRRADITRGET